MMAINGDLICKGQKSELTNWKATNHNCQRHGYSLSRIFNMDETPVQFELPFSQTLEFKLKVNNQWLYIVFLYFSSAYK